MSYRDYSDDQFKTAVANNKSVAGVLRELKLRPVGGNYKTVHRNVQLFQLNTDHWTNQGWNKGHQLKDWSHYRRNTDLKKHLVKDRGHMCESCLNNKWMQVDITLELEHIDGDVTNNQIDNLKLLCPNCHSLTPTWRRRKSSLS